MLRLFFPFLPCNWLCSVSSWRCLLWIYYMIMCCKRCSWVSSLSLCKETFVHWMCTCLFAACYWAQDLVPCDCKRSKGIVLCRQKGVYKTCEILLFFRQTHILLVDLTQVIWLYNIIICSISSVSVFLLWYILLCLSKVSDPRELQTPYNFSDDLL